MPRNKLKRYTGAEVAQPKSIAEQLLTGTKLGNLLYGKQETYKDGNNQERKDTSFKESANGQLVQRMGETAKGAGELVATGLAFGNPLTASNVMSPLIAGSQAYWIGHGINDGTQRIDNIEEGVKNFVEDPSWQNAGTVAKEVPMLALDVAGAVPVAKTATTVTKQMIKPAPTYTSVKQTTIVQENPGYINTIDDALPERQPLTTNMSKQFWRDTSKSKLTLAEKAGIPKGERSRYETSLGKSKISPEEKAGLPKSIRNNGKYNDLTFFRVSHDVPTVNDDGFAVLTDPNNYFLNTTTDGLVHTHGNYPYLKNHVYAIDPEGLRGSTLFSTEPSDMFFDTRTLKIKPKHVTFISGDPDALKQAADAGFKTMSSPKLKLLFKQSRASYPYISGKRVVLPEDYHQSLRSFVDSYFSRPSMDTYEKISRQTTLPISVKPFTGRNFIKTGKDVNWSPSDFRNVVYDPASPIEYNFKEKIGLNPYVGYFTSIFDKIKLSNAAKNIKPLKQGGKFPFYLKYFNYGKR